VDNNGLDLLFAASVGYDCGVECYLCFGVWFHRAVCWFDDQEAKEELRTAKHIVPPLSFLVFSERQPSNGWFTLRRE
jgi:hypothetical protein